MPLLLASFYVIFNSQTTLIYSVTGNIILNLVSLVLYLHGMMYTHDTVWFEAVGFFFAKVCFEGKKQINGLKNSYDEYDISPPFFIPFYLNLENEK